MKTTTRPAKSKPAKRPNAASSRRAAAKRATAARTAGQRAADKRAAGQRAAGKPVVRKRSGKHASGKAAARRPAGRRPAASRARQARQPAAGPWLAFVEQHGVVLASARGPVPCVAEAVAGEPIVGSWWAHPKGKAIFAALSELDESDDVRCFKLIDGKITFVHRRIWPALARLATSGAIAAARVAAIQQEHMPTGEHRNVTTPFPDWVPDEIARAATSLTIDDARAQLGAWV